MVLKDHDLRQLNQARFQELLANDPEALLRLTNQLFEDLKEARERLNQNASNSSRPPSSQDPWFRDNEQDGEQDTQEEADDASGDPADDSAPDSTGSEEKDSDNDEESEPKTPKRQPPKPKNKPGKQPGAPGFGRTQELPIHETHPHYPESCALCGRHLDSEQAVAHNAFVEADLLFGEPEKPGLTLWCSKHIYYEIPCCCGHITQEMPHRVPEDPGEWKGVALSEWRLAGPGLCAYIVWLHFRMHLSLRKIRELLEETFGLLLSIGLLQKCLLETARACDPLFLIILACLLDESLLHADETPHKEAGDSLWLWTFVTASTVLFLIGRRTKEVWLTVGLLFSGWLMSDGYQVYRDHKKRLRCWAHLIRKAKGLAETLTPWIQGYGREVLEILDTLMKGIYQAREGPGGSIREHYQKELDRLQTLCEKMARSSHDKAHALGVEFLNDWDAIFRVLDHPELPLTNNAAEQMLRHWVMLRKIGQGTRSKQGSRALTLLASVIETCRRRQASPLRYLNEVIDRRRRGLEVPELPPVPKAV